MSYELDERGLAVEVLYMESARHSNANLLHATGEAKRYIGIAKAMFSYAVRISKEAGFDSVLIFKAKTSELLEYYMREFGARQVGIYDPFRLVLWEDAAEALISEYRGMNMNRSELLHAEESGAASGWVSPLSQEDREYFAYLRKVFKRYNITPSKATRLEYDFVIRVAESEFYLQKANA